jgi:peptidoglycan/LPS O-acetylase OafA/YrhL
MNKQFSIYLDVIRFAAAVLVFISHVPRFSGGWLWQIAQWGHEAVVVFFVLSGFVISYVVFDKKERLTTYVYNRANRIYSVAIPAIIITLISYYTTNTIAPESLVTVNDQLKNPIWVTFSALTFINQSWVATSIFNNAPYWSMGYEVLYYAIFGFAIYAKGACRLAGIIGILVVMGPSIALYLPIWLAGVYCYHLIKTRHMPFSLALLLYLISLIGIVVLSLSDTQETINQISITLFPRIDDFLLAPATMFLSDYVLTIFVCMHIVASYHLSSTISPIPIKIEGMIRMLSSHTFALYLLHMPILFFVSALVPYHTNAGLNLFLTWVLTPAVIFLLSWNIENTRKKTLFTHRKKSTIHDTII